MRRLLKTFGFLSLVSFSSCSPPEPSPDIVLLILDAAPAATAIELPGFDDFARRGSRFTQAYTVSDASDPSLRAMLDGRFFSGPPADRSLAEILAASGRATLALDTRPGESTSAWAAGFDEALDIDQGGRAAATLAAALAARRPLFAVVRLGDATRETGERLRQIAAVLDDRTTAWALTSAVGDPSVEGLREARIRVPLFVHEPGTRPALVERPVQSIDLFPAVLRWTGSDPASHPSQGVDPGVGRSAVFCESASSDRRSLRRGRFKILVGGGLAPRLHDLKTDPAETHDRASEPDWAALRNELLQDLTDLASWIAVESGPAPEETTSLDPAALDELRSLGYLE